MFQIDRVVYATSRPEEVDKELQEKYRLPLFATGESFPGVSTRIYSLPGGGTFEIAFVSNPELVGTTEQGQGFTEHLKEHGDSYYVAVLETDDLMRVKNILEEDNYPVQVTPVQQVPGPNGETLTFQMLGTYPHLPWFIKYHTPRQYPGGFPQAMILRSTTFTADVDIMQKILGAEGTKAQLPTMFVSTIPMINGTLRIESADEYGFSFLSPSGLVFDTEDRYYKKGEH